MQLAGAAAAVTKTAQDESAREEDSALTSVENIQEGAGSAIDGVKPKADGESDSRTDSLLNESTRESPAASARDVSREAAPDDILALLKQLDSDLRELERELAELERAFERPSLSARRTAGETIACGNRAAQAAPPDIAGEIKDRVEDCP